MLENRTREDVQFDDDLDQIVRGEDPPGAIVTEEDEYAWELATARMFSAHFAPPGQPPTELRDRIWRQTQERINTPARTRLQLPSGPHPLLAFPRRQLIAIAAAVLLMLSAITPVGPQVVALAQEIMEARGWVERAPAPGDGGATIEVDSTDLPPGAPTIGVDAVTIPYDPNAREQIEPANVPAEGATPD